jgi:hypothetical protein
MRLKFAIPFAQLLVAFYGCSSDAATHAPGAAPVAPVTPAPAGAAGSTATPPTMTPTAVVPTAPATTPTPVTPPSSAPAPVGNPGATPTPSGTAGAAAPAATAGSAAPTTPTTMGNSGASVNNPMSPYPDPRGKCTINSGYPDDNACLVAPAAEEGLQIHVGPTDYTNAAEVAKYILMPGEETSECWTFHTSNTKEVMYQTFELSGRSGTHHIINTMYNVPMTDGGFGVCADPGTGTNGNIIDNLPGASKAYMPRGIVAPENENIGRKIPPNTPSQADMHYYNFTDKPLIREFWMNIYTVDPSKVKQQADQIRGMGGVFWNIPAHSENTYKYQATISGNGRILSLLGHYHAHGKRFTASLKRASGGAVEKVFEMYDYRDPATFEYDSVQTNPMFSDSAAGAVSGMLDVKNGDVLMWECYIVNDSDVSLTYKNEVKTGEMCNMWGSSLGITAINSVLP